MCIWQEKRGISDGLKNCFKNWNASSPAMKADMIVQMFNLSREIIDLTGRAISHYSKEKNVEHLMADLKSSPIHIL
ncbi:hypothetical protein J437_LFUL003616, partial [Ladona fulva]